MKSPRPLVCSLIAWVSWISLAVAPAQAQPPGGQLTDQVLAAYADVQQYQATLHFALRHTQGRWTTTQAGDFQIALDRPSNRLLVDTPDQLLAADGQKLRYRHNQLPGKHLEVDAVSPLTGEWVFQQVPMLAQPIIPTDLALLIATDPLKLISDGATVRAAQVPPGPDGRPRLEIPLQVGTMTLTIDPKTHLASKAHVQVNTTALGAPAGMMMSYTFDIEITNLNQPIDPQVFALDTTGSMAMTSLQAMMGGGRQQHPMVGQDAPAITTVTVDGDEFKLEDEHAKVIVLDFWATWCQPCQPGLQELQEVYDWAQREGKSLAIYAINQGETPDEVRAYWEHFKLTMPVLMDEKFVATQAYGVTGVPETMIISGGKVRIARRGYGPGIKAEIEALLNADPE